MSYIFQKCPREFCRTFHVRELFPRLDVGPNIILPSHTAESVKDSFPTSGIERIFEVDFDKGMKIFCPRQGSAHMDPGCGGRDLVLP